MNDTRSKNNEKAISLIHPNIYLYGYKYTLR
jgi:hypothetical protein